MDLRPAKRPWTSRLYSLRALVLGINLVVLALPLFGIGALRMMENFLHRQAEGRLIAEATYIRALYLAALAEGGAKAPGIADFSRALTPPPFPQDAQYDPYFPEIDLLFDPVLPPTADPRPASRQAALAASTAGRRIEPLIKEAQAQNLSGVRVLDPQGVVVASTGGELGYDYRGRPEVERALQGHYAGVVRERASQPSQPGMFNRESRVRVHVALPIIQTNRLYGVVYLNRTSLSLFLDVWERSYTIALLVILLLTVGIGLMLGAIITRPLRDLIDKTQRIANGEQVTALTVGRTAPREARDLSAALTAMLGALTRQLDYVREFTRGVSHELKTPIASIRGAVELLASDGPEMTDEERQHFFGMVEADVRRMDRLVRRLTELARIETAPRRHEQIVLDVFLGELVESYRETGHEVAFESAGPCSVQLGLDLAETLFGNLVDNALRHGRGQGVTVRLEVGPRVVVSDLGPGISAANLPHVFERFFTTARGEGGTGLGLAMVKAIAEANGAVVTVVSTAAGTSFTVDFAPALRGALVD